MPPRKKKRFWRLCRIYFRHFRITVWILVLLLLGCLIYVNQIGLPGFVKRPLLDKLRARGVDLQFSRLRLRWYQGIVADNVRFGRADDPASPQLRLAEVQVQLNRHALARFQLQIDSLMVRQGRLILPIIETNQPPRQLSIDDIRTDLRFLPNDQWALDNFRANFAGAAFQLSGAITNASAVRDWKFFQPSHRAIAADTDRWQNRLRKLSETLESIRFSAPPELKMDVRGDARDLQSFSARLMVSAPGAVTPWGAVSEGRFTGHLLPATNNEVSHAELSLAALDAQTPWGDTTNLQITVHLAPVEGQTNQVGVELALSAGQVMTKWAAASNAQVTANWVHALTNPIPISGQVQVVCDAARSEWGTSRNVRLSGRLGTPRELSGVSVPNLNWSYWTNIASYLLDWDCHLRGLDSEKFKVAADDLSVSGNWRPPDLALTNFHATLYQGTIDGQAHLNVATRALDAAVSSQVDPHKIGQLLTEGARHWLADFAWLSPPQVQGNVSLVLPAWTNRHPDWRAEVLPTLNLQGEFKLDHACAYREVLVSSAHSHLSYSNMTWRLPDLTATRPEGVIEAAHVANDRTKDFYWLISSSIDINAIRPLFNTNQLRALDFVSFPQPPFVTAEIWGRWRDHERLGIKARVAATNFTVRGETVTSFQSAIQYTNRYLELFEPRAQVGPQPLGAAGLAIDFPAYKIYLTNGFATADPRLVTRMIGPRIEKIIEPYNFGQPPVAFVNGTIPMRNADDADLHFELEGGPFHWWKINASRISGGVHWVGQTLSLSNVQASLYGGKAACSAFFKFKPRQGADFRFDVAATNLLLQLATADFTSSTNHRPEGFLSGSLHVPQANTADTQSWQGFGDTNLRDGLLWDIPMFGIFSPVLNGISPGLGNSRASAATASFVITNSVIRTSDLEIRSAAMRLEYRGIVDFQGRLDARVEAELLRDMWVVGPLISTVFWPVSKMFEYKVSGTLSHPHREPLNPIARGVLMPFHPFRALRDLVPDEPSPAPRSQ